MPVGNNSAQLNTPPLFAPTSLFVRISNACGSVDSITAFIIISDPSNRPSAYRVTNSASSYASGENGFGIAQGSLFVVYGQALGPNPIQQASSFPIPVALAGTSVQINMTGTNYTAPVIYSSFAQVAAILPSVVPIGDGTLVVTYNGAAASPIPIHVVKSAFGIFTLTSNGVGAGVIHDAGSRLLTFAQPAHPGDTVVIWGTGLGPVPSNDAGIDASGPLPGNRFTPEVFVGNQPVPVQYAGRSGCCAALDQIVIQLPPAIQGCFVPLVVRTNGIVSNFVSLPVGTAGPIGTAGKACADPVGVSPELMTKAATDEGIMLAMMALGPIPVLQNAGASFIEGLSERLSALLGVKVSEQDLRTLIRASGARRGRALKVALKKYAPLLRARNIDPDTIVNAANALNYQGAAAYFQQLKGPTAFNSQFVSAFPPPGTCTAGRPWSNQPRSFGAANRAEDAGPQLLLTGPAGTQALKQLRNGEYQLPLGPGSTAVSLPQGTYSISSTGGRDVGAFTARIDAGPKLTWSNKSSVGFIDRSKPLTINWSGGAPNGYIVFGGASSAEGVQAAFLCVEDVRKQTLTVPDFVLSAIPRGSSDHGSTFLTAHPLQNVFTARGIDVGFFADLSSDSKEIGFQ